MTATTISQVEGTPAAYPNPPAGLSTEAAALDADMVWQRVESYVCWRWSERTIEFVVEGPGNWQPPLKPTTISTVERWTGTAWEATTDLLASPLGGYQLPSCGPFKFTGTLGVDEAVVPAIVLQAWRRLAEYMAAKVGKAGTSSETVTAGSVTISHQRSASWTAKAIDNSGAGDLLRTFRRA